MGGRARLGACLQTCNAEPRQTSPAASPRTDARPRAPWPGSLARFAGKEACMLAHPRRFLRRYWLEVLLVLPLTLYILLLTFVPVLQAIGLSFTDRYTGAFPSLSNYQYVMSRPDFGAAFVNTIGITL